MTMMSELPQELVEEILYRVPITFLETVRCTCKLWNNLSKTRVLCKSDHQFFGLMHGKIFSMRFNLHGILKEDREEFCDVSIKPICHLLNDQVWISKISSCHGLLLCVTRNDNNSRSLLVWNPYLGQTRLIQPRKDNRFGAMYALGYDKNKNHKILRLFDYKGYYEVYDFKSNSWSSSNVIPNWKKYVFGNGISLNGNTYFMSCYKDVTGDKNFLLCFDFTTERFGQILPLPHGNTDSATLSCVKEEKLAALYHEPNHTFVTEIWLTTNIDPNAASWSKFLTVGVEQLTGGFEFSYDNQRFFVDEEMKVAVLFSLDASDIKSFTAYIVRDSICMKKVDIYDKLVNLQELCDFWSDGYFFSYYVPSVVQITEHKVKKKKRKQKRIYKKRNGTNKGGVALTLPFLRCNSFSFPFYSSFRLHRPLRKTSRCIFN